MTEDKKDFCDIDLYKELKRIFGFSKFKGNQESVVKNILEGKNVLVIMPTGGGKSLCYQLPALIKDGTAIIISPLISLMKNEVLEVKKDIKDGVTKLLYVAPESLTKAENVSFLKEIQISFYAIDEAHCISEWGHDFRPEYRRIRTLIEEIGISPIIAL